jgi:hypothetical protein
MPSFALTSSVFFTNVPVDEAVQFIRNKLHNKDKLAEWSTLEDEAMVEMQEV